MNTDINTTQKKKNSIIDTMLDGSKKENYKLIEELWDYCKEFPNDYDLGKNLRMFILTKTIK